MQSVGKIKRVVFVEIKTGTSALSSRERRVREAIQTGKVEWMELRPAAETSRGTPRGQALLDSAQA
jgi:predicted Holliday junction resolvase-like endonuclease